MARMKSRPLQRTSTKRKSQDRGAREGLRATSRKRVRLQTPEGGQAISSKKAKKKKGRPPQVQNEDAHLPPELRRAGLLAHMQIPKGKCFGPFRGKIVDKRKSPDKTHFLVSEVEDKSSKKCQFFYAHKNEKGKCRWLSRLQSAPSKQKQNIVAYNCSQGVCFEALKDIAAGEELMVLFDKSFKGLAYPAYIESVPLSFITDGSGQQIAVVPLDKDVDRAKVYVSSNDDDDDENEAEGTSGKEKADSGGVEVMEVDSDNDDDRSDSSDDDDDDDDDEEEEDGDEDNIDIDVDGDRGGDDGDDNDDDDDDGNDGEDDDDESDDDDEVDDTIKDKDYEVSVKVKLVSGTKRSADDETETEKKASRRKNRSPSKRKPKIKEIKIVDVDNGQEGAIKYQCAHCSEEFTEKEKAQQHSSSAACWSKTFRCDACTQEFKHASLLKKHRCGGTPKCKICDEEFELWKQLQDHKNSPPEDHTLKCVACDLPFQSLKEKHYHVRTKHGPTAESDECPICHKTYNKVYLKEHLMTHGENDTLKCKECGKKFSSKSNLNKHMKKHLPDYIPDKDLRRGREKKYACTECDKRFDSTHGLESHQRSHTGERPFQCEQCLWKFTQKTHLNRHIKCVHNKVPRSRSSEGLPVTCEVCNKQYVNSRVLAIHVQSVHEGLRPYKCEYCDATYTQRGHLWRHKHSIHSDKDEVQKKYTSDKFVCNFEECEVTFDTQPELTEHVKTHSTDKACMCNECGATFVSLPNLAKHTRRRHDEQARGRQKGYRCEKCDKTFMTSYQLAVHFRCHTGEKPYKCDLCGKSFVQKSGMRKHIKCRRCPMVEGRSINPSKNVTKKYACEHCDKMFPGPSDLKSHMRTHTGEKPFQCTVCDKTFSQPGNLTKHTRYVHNKEERPKEKGREKKYFCSLCGKAFLCPSSLAMHCRTHTGDKPYSCEQCGQGFTQQGNLKKHLKRWHEEGAECRPRRKKGKGKKKGAEIGETETQPQESRNEPEESNTRQTASNNTGRDSARDNTAESAPAADRPVMQANANTQTSLVGCTPLNTPTHLYGATPTPLNTAVSSPQNANPAQRMPVLLGFVGNPVQQPMQHSMQPSVQPNVQSMQPSLSPSMAASSPARIRAPSLFGAGQRNSPVRHNVNSLPASHSMNSQVETPQNLSTMTAQQLQQVVISRMLSLQPSSMAAESNEVPFLPPNVAGPPPNSNTQPRGSILLPHVHSLLNPPGVNPAGSEVAVWPFAPNTNMYQQ